jgi:hypothetical protein
MTWTQHIRVLYQAFFLSVFLWMLSLLANGDLGDLPFSSFHYFDPLSALGVTVGTGSLPGFLIWGVVLLALTLVFGRFFLRLDVPVGNFATAHELAVFRAHPAGKPDCQSLSPLLRPQDLHSGGHFGPRVVRVFTVRPARPFVINRPGTCLWGVARSTRRTPGSRWMAGNGPCGGHSGCESLHPPLLLPGVMPVRRASRCVCPILPVSHLPPG